MYACRVRAHKQRRAAITLGILLACCPCAFALNPSLDISQYAHTAWKVRDGFSQSAINGIAQTPDGYLWLGTEFGLLRFDGVRSVPWQPPTGQHLPSSIIWSMLAARDGTLWIGTLKGLASWKDGKLTQYPELAGMGVTSLLEDREGTIWVGAQGTSGRLCAIQGGRAHCSREDGSLAPPLWSLYEDRQGKIWAGVQGGLWRWKPGPPKLYPMPDTVQALIDDHNGALLVGMPSGIRRFIDGKVQAYPSRGGGRQFSTNCLLRDRNGGLWIGTLSHGLFHVHDGRTDVFAQSDGLSGDFILRLFEDREGNIWVATSSGLDRFREFTVPTVSVKQGLSSTNVLSVLASKDGSVWFATDDGLNRWNNGQITIYRTGSVQAASDEAKRTQGPAVREISGSRLPDDSIGSLFEDDRGRIWISIRRGGVGYFENGRFMTVSAVPAASVYSFAGDRAGNLWIGQAQSLLHLLEGSVVERISWDRLRPKDFAWTLLADPLHGGLWLGFRESGVAYFKDGEVRASYAAGDGLGHGVVNGLHLDQDGTLWAATEGGLSWVKNGRVATLTSRNGLPCDTVNWVMEDDAHSLWLYMACGLVRIARPELDAWVADSNRTIQANVFDSSDGVRSHPYTTSSNPLVAQTADGRLWFLPFDGVSVVDPHHLAFNKLPPPVNIEQITADDKSYDATNGLRLPPRVHSLAIDYTALSLVVPEKVHFRYKLEGQDKDWREVVNDREVQYTNLPPKHYRFRVLACNNSGVWNEEGAALDFVIPPAWYQTNWFRAACVAAFLGMIWGIYELRVRQLAAQLNMRLEERVSERTRIARDLHDTLLQSFQGLVFRFQAARYQLPDRPEEASEALDSALVSADRAIAEGRSAIQELRSGSSEESNLEQMLLALGREMAASQNGGDTTPSLRVIVEGNRRAKRAMIREEVYRIAREFLRNAYRHARARNIEAELRYDDDAFLLIVRDDGKGIDPNVLKDHGRAGHWGLPGMYERAEGMGARLDIWSEVGAGTELRLKVPAAIAYEKIRR
jgi:signal transduction histidine kinase/ligand-binding sensor domain-containing protein